MAGHFLLPFFQQGKDRRRRPARGGILQRKAENKMIRRLHVVAALFGILCFVCVVVRLFYMQVVNYDFYQQKALSQQTRDKTLTAVRGTIYDARMKPLAISASTEMVTIEAVKIKDEEQGLLVAQRLSELLEMDYDAVLKKVQEKSTYAVLKKGVEKEVTDQIRAFIKENDLNCIFMAPDSTRYYPFGNFLSHVLGFVGSDGQGLSGLESQYESELSGTPGRVITATNARGDEMPFAYEMYYDAEDGHSLVLTIDEVIQHYLEKNLEMALYDNKVQNKVAGIVMDVNTGGILAMATKPDFDPNAPFTVVDEAEAAAIAALTGDERAQKRREVLNEQWRNKAISDAYDPGSTFKILTASMALEEKTVSLDSRYYCPGYKMVDKWKIRCWRTAGHGSQSLVEAICNSCNPAFIEIGQSLGIGTFSEYFRAFGLREKTGIDLPGEAEGIYFSKMGPTDLAVAAFGQNFSITPLQLITAVSAVANGGTLLKPYIVKEIIDSDGNILQTHDREEVRQVISKETSAQMCDVLEEVVTHGTGGNAYVMGYRIAGKTGTSEKKAKELATGVKGLRISSFVAFAPADDPQIAVLVMLDEPSVYPVTGGITVAPVIRRIMEDVLPYLEVEPIYTEGELEQKDVTVPGVVGYGRAQAESTLKQNGIKYRAEGSGDTVTDQIPAAGAVVSSKAEVILYMGGTRPEKLVTVPNLAGMTRENARRALSNVNLYLKATGATNSSGGNVVAIRQDVEAEQKVAVGSVITVDFSDLDQRAE
mgnify:CR=1 FL=1